jgi:hypothetical protein
VVVERRSKKVYGTVDLRSRGPGEKRALGYLTGAMFASLIYVGWLIVLISGVASPGAPPYSRFIFELLFAWFLWLTDGFALTLLLMIIPWIIAVLAYRKLRWAGRIYFPCVGALIVFTFGCTTASLSPKPLFIEDQTFLEGAVIAAERLGIGLVFAGIAFGASYWCLGERQIPVMSDKP